MLLTLTAYLPELDTRASHINHGVQSAALDWVAHCRALCARLKVPLDVAVLSPPIDKHFVDGFEAWARAGRYAHWQQLLGRGDVLLLAHHRSDLEETVALKLLQGRLPLPMPASRSIGGPYAADGARLLRPWLSQPGRHTRSILTAAGESWIEDPSNKSSALLRNRLRNELLPVLLQEASGWSAALERCGGLTERLVREFSSAMVAGAQVGEVLRLPLVALECPQAVLGALVAVVPDASRGLGRSQIAAALDQLKRQSKAQRGRADRQGMSLESYPGMAVEPRPLTLWLADDLVEPEVLIWREPKVVGHTVQLSARGELEVELEHGWLRLRGKAGLVLTIRTLEPGDRVLQGGKHRPVREVLRDGGVPRWARASYPLVCSALEGASETARSGVLAVPLYVRLSVREEFPPPATTTAAIQEDRLEASFLVKSQVENQRK